MANTTGGRYYYTNPDAANDIGGAFQRAAEREDTFFVKDLLGNRPASPATPQKPGRRFYATDTGDKFLDLGTAWLADGSLARAACAAGATVTTGVFPMGTLTQTVAGVFSLVTVSGVANAGMSIAKAGVYDVTARLGGSSGNVTSFILENNGVTYLDRELLDGPPYSAVGGRFQLAAGAVLVTYVSNSGAWSANLAEFHIQRVGS